MNIKKLIEKSLLKLIPVKKNRIVFTSYDGHYSDSPKCICEKIKDLNKSLELIWIVDKKYKDQLPDYVKVAEYGSFIGKYYYASANIIIDNVYGGKEIYLCENDKKSIRKYKILRFLNTKKKQCIYTTWHGIPIKKMGRDQIGNKIYDFECPNTVMILGSKYEFEVMKRLTFNKIDMKLIGSPRDDILYVNDEKYINEKKKKLGLEINKKIILFAPTFRTEAGSFNKNIERSGLNQLNEIDIENFLKVLRRKFGGEWSLVCRFHYHVANMIDWEKLKEKYGDRIINGNQFDDMEEYLSCADILLTDISSCIFDFAITKKPILCFFPDVEYYINEERGLYIPIEEFPFEISKTFSELLLNIEAFEFKDYEMRMKKFNKKYGYIDIKDSTIKVAKYILNDRNLL